MPAPPNSAATVRKRIVTGELTRKINGLAIRLLARRGLFADPLRAEIGYIISQSELPNLDPRQMQIVGVVARYHRKGEPSERHEEYAKLTQKERQRVNRLAAILRFADSLDREHQQRVSRALLTEGDGDEIVLRLEGAGDMLLEHWALQKRTGLFEKVFECKLVLEAAK